MSDLKPCPFCGSEPNIDYEKGRWSVMCIRTACGLEPFTSGETREQVTAVWNRRPSLEPPASDELSGISGELPPASDVAGWRLVPMEPTPEMMNAAPASYSPSMKVMWPLICGDIYRAMIAAAPPHPASKEVGDE